ncbi:hypothetical protein ValLY3_48 [Vibrio phage ValLY_3]|uniref:Tail assembly protein n=1 Tax=Vibrio phage ValLY_3 TaxID=2484244 RepID=A0A411BJI4_9CAUD|nr:hypothetical protein ValLY3_48 [Vibrio phage ValLY_3]
MAAVRIFGQGVGYTLIPEPPLPTEVKVALAGSTDAVLRTTPQAPSNWATRKQAGSVGYVADGPWSLLKNSIFMQPKSIDLGLVLGPSTHAVRIWSLYENAITSPTITVTGGTGISLTGTTSNVTLHPYGGFADYTVNVSLAVSGIIDAKYQWNFNGIPASLQTLSITGQRIVVFGIPPQRRVTEKLSWRTDVIRALDGSEQRIRVRENPLVNVRFKSVIGYYDTQGAEAMLYTLGHDALAIPVWHESVRTSVTVLAGTTELNIDTTGSTFKVGDLLILWKGFYEYETGEVSAVTNSKITLKKPTRHTWDKPIVAPLSYGLIDSVNFGKYKINVSDNSVEYTRNANFEIPEVGTYPLYDGIPVYGELLYQAGKSSPNTYKPSVQTVDFGIKARSQKKLFEFPEVTREILVKMNSPQEVLKIKKFLSYLGGKQKPFWYVSHWVDFLPTGVTTVNTELRVRDIGLVEYYASAPTRKWLAIKPRDGDWVYRQISSVAKGATIQGVPANEVITVDTALPFAFSNETVEKVCLMVPVRLTHDDVVFNWDNMQHITTSWKVLEVTK